MDVITKKKRSRDAVYAKRDGQLVNFGQTGEVITLDDFSAVFTPHGQRLGVLVLLEDLFFGFGV